VQPPFGERTGRAPLHLHAPAHRLISVGVPAVALGPHTLISSDSVSVQVGSILLTGSAQTYDAIVWGADKSKVCFTAGRYKQAV
jgi:hypothetical protein